MELSEKTESREKNGIKREKYNQVRIIESRKTNIIDKEKYVVLSFMPQNIENKFVWQNGIAQRKI